MITPSTETTNNTKIATKNTNNLTMRNSYVEQDKMRVAIEMVFQRKYLPVFDEMELDGKNGIVHSICRDLCYNQPKTVKRLINVIKNALDNGDGYDLKRKHYQNIQRNNQNIV